MKESSFVHTIDLYGLSPHLFIKEKTKETSHIGACATILSFLAIASIVLYYFITFLNGVGMTVISSVDNVNHPISFDLREKLLMFKFMDSNFDPVDPRIAKLSIVNTKYERGSILNTDVQVTKCTQTQAQAQAQERSIEGTTFSEYLCLGDNSDQTTLAYNNQNYTGSFLYLLLSKCINTTNDQSCLPQQSIEEYLRSQTLFLSFRVDDSKIDHRQKVNPLDSTPFQLNIRITPYDIVDTQFYWKTVEYKSDEGFFFPSWKIHQDFQFDNSLTTQAHRSNFRRDVVFKSFSSFELHLSPKAIIRYEREYAKLPFYLAQISALTHVVLFLGKGIVDMMCAGMFYFKMFTLAKLSLSPMHKHSLTSVKTKTVMNIKSEIVSMKENRKEKVNYCTSFHWLFRPNLNNSTKVIQSAYEKIAELLSVENIISKMVMLDTLIIANDLKSSGISYQSKTPNNSKILNISGNNFKETSHMQILNPGLSAEYTKN